MSMELLNRLPKEKLLEMYEMMVRIRTFEETSYFLFLQGALSGTIHQCTGQEAVAVGVCSALAKEDFIASNHRSHGHSLAKGMSSYSAMAELYGKQTGCCQGKGGSMHFTDFLQGISPATGVIGESILTATGLGLAFKMQSKDLDTQRVAVAFFGDGASNIGAFHEGINMGAIWQLPVLYICENNKYGASTPVETMVPVEDISIRSTSYNIPGVTVDGMDVLDVYKVVEEAVERARSGKGPTLIECKTYRYVGHSRVDACSYRTKEELEYWKNKDPIVCLAGQLIDNSIVMQSEIDEINKKVNEEIEQAVAKADRDPKLDELKAVEDVYA